MFENYKKTCSITNIQDGCVTFAMNENYLKYRFGCEDKDAWVIVPSDIDLPYEPHSKGLKYYRSVNPVYEFTMFHNEVHKDFIPPSATIGNNCKIHPSVIMDVEGIKFANCPDGSKLQFKHIGNLIIEDDVEIGPLCVLHRGTMDSTILRRGVKLASKINVGHNAIIGENTAIASGAILGGSTIGKNCWIGMGVIINQGLTICNNVSIGSGTVVVKDINKPGIYVGNPARYLKPITERWNF